MSGTDKLGLDESTKNISINTLDTKCLLKIFSYLTTDEDKLQIKNVCKKWRDASQMIIDDKKNKEEKARQDNDDEDFIHKHFEGFPEQSELNSVLRDCGEKLSSLTLSNYCYDSKIMLVISQYCHNLKKLELDLYKYNENDFLEAFTKLNKLKSITISYSNYVDHNDYGDDTVILKSLPEFIEEISLSSAAYDLNFLVPLSEKFTMTLNKFNTLRTLELRYWSLKSCVLKMILQKKTLINLTLAESELLATESMPQNLINLEYLDLSYAKNIDTLLSSIADNSKKLKHLDISQCTGVTIQSLIKLANLKELKKIYLNYIEQVNDRIIGGFCDLNVLECEGCVKVSDQSVMIILNNSSNLEYLNVQRTSVTTKTLASASDNTKKRDNHCKLQVVIDEKVVDDFEEIDDIPLALIINELI